MPFSRRTKLSLVMVTTLVAPLALWGSLPLIATGQQSQGDVQQRIDKGKQREQQLGSAAERLSKLEKIAERGIAVLERRQSDAQADLDKATGRLERTEARLEKSRKRLASQQRRLRRDRKVLADNLSASYKRGNPDLASVVIEAGAFAELIERFEFERSVQSANGRIMDNVRDARAQTKKTERSLQKAVPEQRRQKAEVQRERDALAERGSALRERRAVLAEAKAARLAALRATRSDRQRAQRTLKRLVDQQQKASVDKSGPGGPWAIPWAIVQCESGGQNTPPNSAGASGYYQFIPSTWKGLGGSTAHAYQASKAEQDRLAAKLWAGGAGARNWDCAAIVGLI